LEAGAELFVPTSERPLPQAEQKTCGSGISWPLAHCRAVATAIADRSIDGSSADSVLIATCGAGDCEGGAGLKLGCDSGEYQRPSDASHQSSPWLTSLIVDRLSDCLHQMDETNIGSFALELNR